jgi:hypothetical protein
MARYLVKKNQMPYKTEEYLNDKKFFYEEPQRTTKCLKEKSQRIYAFAVAEFWTIRNRIRQRTSKIRKMPKKIQE